MKAKVEVQKLLVDLNAIDQKKKWTTGNIDASKR